MKITKYINLLIIALILILCLISCNVGDETTNSTSDENFDSDQNHIGDTNHTPSDQLGGDGANANIIEIDIFDYIGVNYGGCNNYGFLRSIFQTKQGPSINTLEYLRSVFGSQYNIPGSLSGGELFSLFDIVEKSERTDLSNGDTIVLSLILHPSLSEAGETLESVMDALNIRFTKTETIWTVSGLEEATVIDMWSVLKNHIKLSYADGCGEITYTLSDDFAYEQDGFYIVKGDFYNNVFYLIYNNKQIAQITLTVEANGKLSEGMNVNIESYVKVLSRECDKNYYILPNAQYTIPFLGTYLTSKDDLTKQNIEEIIKYTEYLASKNYGEGKYKIEGIYFSKIKPQALLYEEYDKSGVVVVVSCKGLWSDKVVYLNIRSKEFFKNKDGSLNFPISRYTGAWTGFFDSIYSGDPNDLSYFNSDYTYEKIN